MSRVVTDNSFMLLLDIPNNKLGGHLYSNVFFNEMQDLDKAFNLFKYLVFSFLNNSVLYFLLKLESYTISFSLYVNACVMAEPY